MRLSALLRDLRRSQSGFAAWEFIVIVPIFIAAMMLTFTAFDMYRVQSRNHRAAIGVADALSREVLNITPTELDTLFKVQGQIIQKPAPRMLRIVVVQNVDGEREIRWTQAQTSGGALAPPFVEEDIPNYVPELANGEVVILVLSHVDAQPFSPIFRFFSLETIANKRLPTSEHIEVIADTAVRPMRMQAASVMRPRNAPQLCWSATSRDTVSPIERQC